MAENLSRARDIALAVRTAGGRALYVGGCVRDRIMGRQSKDIDVEVFGVPADRLKALLESLGRVDTVGESFQVFKAGDVDVSLPRRESKSGLGHRGFEVSGDPSMRIPSTAAATSSGGCCGSSTPRRLPTTAFARSVRFSSRRGFRSHSTTKRA